MSRIEPRDSAKTVLLGWLLLCALTGLFLYVVVFRGAGA